MRGALPVLICIAALGFAVGRIQPANAQVDYGPAGISVSWTVSGADHVAYLTAQITSYGYPSVNVFLTSYAKAYLQVNTALSARGTLTTKEQKFPKDIFTKVVVPARSTNWVIAGLPLKPNHPRVTRSLRMAFTVRRNIPRDQKFCARVGFIGTEPPTSTSDPFPPDYVSQNLCLTGKQWYEASTLK
jgi:hypothetical protein